MKTTDPDADLLLPAQKQLCAVMKLVNSIEIPEWKQAVLDALAQPPRKIPGPNIAEWLHRKTGTEIHESTVGRHRRGVCGCARERS